MDATYDVHDKARQTYRPPTMFSDFVTGMSRQAAATAQMVQPDVETQLHQYSQLPPQRSPGTASHISMSGSPRPPQMQIPQPRQEPTYATAPQVSTQGMKDVNTPHDMPRTLPSTDPTKESQEDGYVQFIFYCNPSIPTTTDTTALRRGFKSVPRADGKEFDPWTLFLLIRRLHNQEINTWTDLVLTLGVEPPDPAKNQSTQKVQQFAVRLKRWLHAYHIDAYFQYCFGKPNSYYTEVPGAEEDFSQLTRDNVPSSDDLAIRALLPDYRPKRGRRKGDGESENPKAKRASSAGLEAHSQPPPSAQAYTQYPQSAFPWTANSSTEDAWSAAQRAIDQNGTATATDTPSGQYGQNHNFWPDATDQTPSTPYAHSGVNQTPLTGATLDSATPQSAHPSSTPKRKRPASSISAAWSGGTSNSTGKIRGRPPSDRTVQDGPYSRFPAKGNGAASSPLNPSPSASGRTPETPTQGSAGGDQNPGNRSAVSPRMDSPRTLNGTNASAQKGNIPNKPSKLQLQVPQHEGGPVRLATPPLSIQQQQQGKNQLSPNQPTPRLLVNGEDRAPPLPPPSSSATISPPSQWQQQLHRQAELIRSQQQQQQQQQSQSRKNAHHQQHLPPPLPPQREDQRESQAEFFSNLDGEFDEDEDEGGGGGGGIMNGHGNGNGNGVNGGTQLTAMDWKRRALTLKRRLEAKERELRDLKTRVLAAVM
ncbi:hypothetical protein MMC25_000958 [Agyrium rufum]|nr:hypothetical protein [Agyrium rufum]